jgi:anti-anti-sigma factor
MEITLSMIRDLPLLRPSGRLDALSAPLLEERLKPMMVAEGQRLIFDCSALDYVSSAGLRVFLSTQRHLALHGGGLAFCCLSPVVAELFALSGLDSHFLTGATPGEAADRLLSDGFR